MSYYMSYCDLTFEVEVDDMSTNFSGNYYNESQSKKSNQNFQRRGTHTPIQVKAKKDKFLFDSNDLVLGEIKKYEQPARE